MTKKDLGGLQVVERSTIEDQVEEKIMERERRKAFKERCYELRSERIRYGIKFWDVKGCGRIIKGKKHYD